MRPSSTRQKSMYGICTRLPVAGIPTQGPDLLAMSVMHGNVRASGAPCDIYAAKNVGPLAFGYYYCATSAVGSSYDAATTMSAMYAWDGVSEPFRKKLVAAYA